MTNAATTSAAGAQRLYLPPLRVALLVVLMLLAAVVGQVGRPTYRLADHKPRIDLERQVPERIGEWMIDRSIVPVLPNPEVQGMLDKLYSQTLARTYVNSKGERIMLSIAYGSDQGSEATAVHRPEFCYSAQGFRVAVGDTATLQLGGSPLVVRRLVARLGQRSEPISYWVTLDESATLPGLGRKIEQIRYGLRGQIPDGMLVRVSSISASEGESFALQQAFLAQLRAAVPAEIRARYFGS